MSARIRHPWRFAVGSIVVAVVIVNMVRGHTQARQTAHAPVTARIVAQTQLTRRGLAEKAAPAQFHAQAQSEGTASGGPGLGSTKATIDSVWQRANTTCNGPGSLITCEYTTQDMKTLLIGVVYSDGRAKTLDLSFDPNVYDQNYPSTGSRSYWDYLVSRLPDGARQTECKYFAQTAGPGVPANACLYREVNHIDLVAQYLTPDGNGTIGTVRLDSGYNDIL